MEKAEYLGTLRVVRQCALMLSQVPIPEAIQTAERADAIGPILDPTLYRTKHAVLQVDIEFMRASLELRKLGLKLFAQLEEDTGG